MGNYSLRKPKNFNNPERFIEGWYWAIPSRQLKVGQVKPVTLLGRELAIYRGEDVGMGKADNSRLLVVPFTKLFMC
jgi:phenylpropionate dioxygenase-like ring-hydroxylating dioxygenase large terminal subunit